MTYRYNICLYMCMYRELPPHPNVVQVFGVSLDGPQPVLVMEYCAGGVCVFVVLCELCSDSFILT
jgi:hypothetical protein